MTNELNNKRLSDDELEAVSGGVTPPSIDPAVLANLTHATVSAAIAGGGAYTVAPQTDTAASPTNTTTTGPDLASIIQTIKTNTPTTIEVGRPIIGS